MKEFSYKTRLENIERLQKEEFDLVIIGGGINGAGVARDASSRGLKVALVEANDFASGTSSKSSKLVHGGIRYLENYEFGLVFEALSERAKLFDLAPHLVHPLRFALPVYKNSRVGMLKMGLGMFLYDLLSTFEAPELFEHLNKEETMDRLPHLDSKDLKGSYVYSDGYMDDDRLVIESLRSANEWGACIANYVKVSSGKWDGDVLKEVICEDQKSGKTFSIKGKHFIGSLGPWSDIFGKAVLKDWKPILRPTKGIHITVAKERVDLKQAVVMFSNDQKRIIFGIPRHEMVIFGTTDTDYQEDPSDVKTKEEDVRYLLEVVNQHFPGIKLTANDIISSYAGIRPLVNDGSNSESKTSREHEIMQNGKNVTLVAGGKYTTYRLIAEEVIEKALESFTCEERLSLRPSQTRQPLNPKATAEQMLQAKKWIPTWKSKSKFSIDEIRVLVDRHGMEAEAILALETKDSESIWSLEAKFALKHTMCMGTLDFYLRRSPLFLSEPDHGLAFLKGIHASLSEVEESVEIAKKDLNEYMTKELAWKNAF